MLAKLVPAQQAGLHACKAGTSPASRPTCSPSWYPPSKQAYLLAELVPAQRAGLPARRAGTRPASRPTCSPSWYQPSEPAYLLAKLVPAQRAGAPLDNRRVIERRKPPLDDRYRPVIKRSAYSSQRPGRTGHQEECVLLSMTGTDRPSRGVRTPLDDRDGPAIKRRTPPLDGWCSPVIKRRRAPLDDWSARVIDRRVRTPFDDRDRLVTSSWSLPEPLSWSLLYSLGSCSPSGQRVFALVSGTL
ncbi:hypothetical protein PCANC_21527 [Puccinia coronata f. sp. avenae]|uniref:Uncharacterized protein n=1 Tax=Puccinia coronata f. sp. avenae TaxID=200324 RepID=A0A2N5TNF5_9BASI|nr:hypothetical protein PCANC_21527 [Puccinia coronata f. sp. avenae]